MATWIRWLFGASTTAEEENQRKVMTIFGPCRVSLHEGRFHCFCKAGVYVHPSISIDLSEPCSTCDHPLAEHEGVFQVLSVSIVFHSLYKVRVLICTLLIDHLSDIVHKFLEYCSRFEPGETYHQSIQQGLLTDLLILDCRRPIPRKRCEYLYFLYSLEFPWLSSKDSEPKLWRIIFFPRLFPRSNPKWRQRRNSPRVLLNELLMECRILYYSFQYLNPVLY